MISNSWESNVEVVVHGRVVEQADKDICYLGIHITNTEICVIDN